jgi:FAD/FMN-containing dehydrogenase
MSVTTTSSGFDRLRSELTGSVYRAGDPAAAAECSGNNLAFPYSATVVAARTAEDVAAAVRYAAAEGLPVTAQATGHGLVGPIEDAVLVSTRSMAGVTVDADAGVARVEPGVRWDRLQAAAEPAGLAGLMGSSSDVGVVGYTLGGGHSPVFGRRYGYAADRVRCFDLVTADGTAHHVDPDHDPELFWAVRGGQGNFGIVTALEFDLVRETIVHGGSVFFPMTAAPDLLHTFAGWSATLPERTTASIALMRMPGMPTVPEPLRGQAVVQLRFSHLGDAEEAERLLAPMRALATPILDGVQTLPTTGLDAIHLDPTDPLPFVYRGTYLNEFPAAAVDAVLAAAGPDATTPLLMVEMRCLGGALARPPAHPNAVAGRSAGWSLFGLAVPIPEIAEMIPQALQDLHALARPWDAHETMVNFAGTGLSPAEMLDCYPADTRRRLLDVKHAVDPANAFRLGCAIAG